MTMDNPFLEARYLPMRTLFIAWFALIPLTACGSDDDSEPKGQHEQPAVCKEISDACHPVDDGTPSPIHDCHELAHGGTADACEAEKDDCIPLCLAAAADAGIEAGAHDGGH